MDTCGPWEYKLENMGSNWEPSQATGYIKLPVVNRGSQYTKQGSFYSEINSEVNNKSFYETL
jgi:hypothetical protein